MLTKRQPNGNLITKVQRIISAPQDARRHSIRIPRNTCMVVSITNTTGITIIIKLIVKDLIKGAVPKERGSPFTIGIEM
jgi:hypothetical protein